MVFHKQMRECFPRLYASQAKPLSGEILLHDEKFYAKINIACRNPRSVFLCRKYSWNMLVTWHNTSANDI